MKTILTAICFLFLACQSMMAASEPQQQFEKANSLFRQKQYSEAAAIYQQLISEGYHQPELFLNAGNAWYKANRTGMAIYNYEKALLEDPFSKQAAHNLSIANQRVEGYVNDLPLLFFQQWWLQVLQLHTPNGWATGAVIFFWLSIAGIIAILLAPAFRPAVLRWATGVAAFFFLCYLSLSISAFYRSSHTNSSGIVLNAAAKVKSAPDQESRDIFELHEGVKVQVTDSTQEYCKILLPDGKTGWLACAEIKRL